MDDPIDRPSSAPGSSNDDRAAFLARLAGGLAHEIKNPLSTMAINLALLQEDWERSAAARGRGEPEPTPREERSLRRIRTLQREVERLEHIVDEFRNFAKGGEINRRPNDLSSILRQVLDFVEPEHEQLGIRHHVDLPLSLPLVLVDEGPFKQALMNLFVNARQAMSDGGELLVRLQRIGNHVELTITDTGVGMTPEQAERCFDVYWSNKKGGTGLGLATTKRIVEEHGGTISVVSEPGRGTSFSITLPLVVELTRSGTGRRAPREILVEPLPDGDAEEPEPREGARPSKGSEPPGTAERVEEEA